MKIIKYLITTFLTLFLLVGCGMTIAGNGKLVSQQRVLQNFKKIDVIGHFVVTASSSTNEQKVTITADENLLPHIKTEIQNDTLVVFIASNVRLNPTKAIEVNIAAKNLQAFSASGFVQTKIVNIKSPTFTLQTHGNIETEASMTTGKIDVISFGVGKTILTGTTETILIRSSGTSEINAKELKANDAEVVSSGSGQILINATRKLQLDVSGNSKIGYYGNPHIEQKISGAAEIKSLTKQNHEIVPFEG